MTNGELLSLLENVFGKGNVLQEWDVARNSEDALKKKLQYCPRIDYAVKPLNIDGNIEDNNYLSIRLGIRSIHTVIFFKGGEVM